jgi:hypothetical protein
LDANKSSKEKTSLHDQFYAKAQGNTSVQSGQGGANNLANLDEEDEADFEAQLMLLGRGKAQQHLLQQRPDAPNV